MSVVIAKPCFENPMWSVAYFSQGNVESTDRLYHVSANKTDFLFGNVSFLSNVLFTEF